MTLQEHLPRELPAYEVTKRPVKVFKMGEWWFYSHHCLHRAPETGLPHASHDSAMYWALNHWRMCR